jgi:hypothetical protein
MGPEVHIDGKSDREYIVEIATVVNDIAGKLRDGAIVINNHENAIRTLERNCVMRSECQKVHRSIWQIMWGLFSLAVVSVVALVAAWIKGR